MIPGIGTLINAFSVMGIGILGRIFIKKEIKNFENNLLPLGLLVLTLGIRESLKSPDFILTLLAVLVGSIIGTYLKIEEKIEKLGEYLHNKFEKNSSGKGRFIESYLTASLIVITGPLAIVGPFLDVVEGNIELTAYKNCPRLFLSYFSYFKWRQGGSLFGNLDINLSRIFYITCTWFWWVYKCRRFGCSSWGGWSSASGSWNKLAGNKKNSGWKLYIKFIHSFSCSILNFLVAP
jgi:hypothetical protein